MFERYSYSDFFMFIIWLVLKYVKIRISQNISVLLVVCGHFLKMQPFCLTFVVKEHDWEIFIPK